MTNSIERRALYHLLRMNWLNDHSLSVEPWQVEDYRNIPLSQLFAKLEQFDIYLDRIHFIAFADECDSPEDLTDHLLGDQLQKPSHEDQIYLVIFELWRQLMSEKPSLSILCHELDHQIYLYDQNQLENPLVLQDTLVQFSQILDQNVDEGIPPQEAFHLVSNYCANDIETFLYDFISEQIEEGNETYAQELLESFDLYLNKNKWFQLLRLRLFGYSFSNISQKLTQQIIEEHLDENDLDFNLELLLVIAQIGDASTLGFLMQKTFPLLLNEENLQDFLEIIHPYYERTDQKREEKIIESLLKEHSQYNPQTAINKQDPDLMKFAQFFNL